MNGNDVLILEDISAFLLGTLMRWHSSLYKDI